jgi:hypothetical protein
VASYTALLFGLRTAWGLGAFLCFDFDFGNVSRDVGNVWVYTWRLGGEISWRWRSRGRMGIDLGAALFAAYALFRAKATLAAVLDRSGSGFTGEALLFAGPVIMLERVGLAMHLHGGYTIPNPVARVLNDDPITPGGFFVGAALRVSFTL